MLIKTLTAICGGFWNCARGRKLFNLTTSTEIGRLVSMTMIALAGATLVLPATLPAACVFIWSILALMLWCSPAWDAYWSVTIGQSKPPVKCFAPVDYIMAIPPFNKLQGRLWGLVAFTLRMQLILPLFIGNMWILHHFGRIEYLPLAAALALPYYVLGYLIRVQYVIPASEFCTGMIIGLTLALINGH